MESKAKQLGIKLSYVRNGKRYRKTDKQLYNAINGKLKVMAFGTGGGRRLDFGELHEHRINAISEKLQKLSGITDAELQKQSSNALVNSDQFIEAINVLTNNNRKANIIAQNFINSDGYKEVFHSEQLNWVGGSSRTSTDESNDDHEVIQLFFPGSPQKKYLDMIILFIMYCKPEAFKYDAFMDLESGGIMRQPIGLDLQKLHLGNRST